MEIIVGCCLSLRDSDCVSGSVDMGAARMLVAKKIMAARLGGDSRAGPAMAPAGPQEL